LLVTLVYEAFGGTKLKPALEGVAVPLQPEFTVAL